MEIPLRSVETDVILCYFEVNRKQIFYYFFALNNWLNYSYMFLLSQCEKKTMTPCVLEILQNLQIQYIE